MSIASRVAIGIVCAAEQFMPPRRKEWARAMAAELPYAGEGVGALAFAVGCLTSAIRERMTAPPERVSSVGMIAGVLFFLHALVPNSQSWPWIWPLTGGAIAAFASAERQGWRTVRRGIESGIVCAVFFFVGGVAFISARVWLAGSSQEAARIGLVVYGSFGAVVLAGLAAGAATVLSRRNGSQCAGQCRPDATDS